MKNNSFYILLIPILLIFVSDNVHAENYHGHRPISDETGDAYTLYFSEHDNDKFEITEIPEKWKNESAVIICQEHVFSYLREKCYSYISESFRRRVKLQDKAAVELFSELYFIKSDDIYNIRINIYKPDGSVIDVSIDDAVEVTQEVPRIFRYGNIKTYQYNKLAVPNLEIGDILDYEISEKNADVNGSIYSLVSSYPIMNQSYVFTLDIGFLLKFNSYNGAPSLEYNSNGKDCYNRERAIVKTYRIDDYDREKIPDINWLNIYRSYPYIKFTIYSPRVYKHLDFYVTNHEKRISVDEDINFDLLRRNYCAGLNVYGNLSYCIHEPSLLRMARKDELLCDSEIEKLELLNEMFRFFYFYHNEYTNDIHYGDVEPNKFIYVWTFRSLLKYYKIDSEFVICIDKDMGSVKNVVSAYELYFGLKLNLDKEIYIFPFDLYSDFGDIPIELQGSEALIYEKIYADSIEPEIVRLPSNNYEKNKYSILSHVSILEDFKKTKIENKSSFYGNMKCRYIPLFISDYTFCYKDWDEFHTYDYLNTYYKIGFGIRDEGQALKNKSDNSNEELLELQKEYYDSNFEFTIESYDLLSVTNFNSITEDKKLEVSNEMIVSDVIFKIGSDYGLNIGYLIGEQIKLEGSELDRKCDIIRDYAATYSIEIVLTIPEGYTISDISPLITIVENESGSFKSDAKLIDNDLIIKTEKIYKNSEESASNFKNYIEFTDAAYNFSQSKIILEKIN